jgi:hypothetical protein
MLTATPTHPVTCAHVRQNNVSAATVSTPAVIPGYTSSTVWIIPADTVFQESILEAIIGIRVR